MNRRTVLTMFKAYEQGHDACQHLKVGEMFKGAWGQAVDHGYEPGTDEFEAFATGFLNACPLREFWTDDMGIITDIK